MLILSYSTRAPEHHFCLQIILATTACLFGNSQLLGEAAKGLWKESQAGHIFVLKSESGKALDLGKTPKAACKEQGLHHQFGSPLSQPHVIIVLGIYRLYQPCLSV